MDFSQWSKKGQEAIRSNVVGSVGVGRVIQEQDCIKEGDWVYVVSADEGSSESYASIVRYEGAEADVIIPSRLGELEVREIISGAFMDGRMESVQMPPTINKVGQKAFGRCFSLKRVVFSDALTEIDASVLSGCMKVTDLTLPASLTVLQTRNFYDCPLQEVTIPAAVAKVGEQVFNHQHLTKIVISPDNPHLSTDGVALFTADGSELISALVTVESYQVPAGCRAIGHSAFKGQTKLAAVDLGNVESIGSFAFFRTGIAELDLPATLRTVGENAFGSCLKLEQVRMADGVEVISDKAFAQCRGLKSVDVPASVRRMGLHAFDARMLAGEGGYSLTVSPENPYLTLDGQGLYSRGEDGLVFEGLYGKPEQYDVAPGTVTVAAGACENHMNLQQVTLPEGIRSIGDAAFRSCDVLRQVNFPDSLEEIGANAFWRTSLESVHLGPKVDRLGKNALETAGDTLEHDRRTIRHLDVDPANERYYYQSNLLIERCPNGHKALVFVEPCDCVVIPEQVTYIADMCFHYAYVAELRFHAGIKHIDPRAMMGVDMLDKVVIDFPHEVDGFDHVEVLCPHHARDINDFSRALCMDEDGLFFDFASYDSMAVTQYDPGMVLKMAVTRIERPIKLDRFARVNYNSALERYMNPALLRYVQTGDLDAVKLLDRNGYLQGENRELAIKIAESENAQEFLAYLNQ
ncbi:MAG: leucine-rich repeat protein [Coriobacteriia bacterium]|nr:leucine-rich repeat protein [Coriobacteriia bacterium]